MCYETFSKTQPRPVATPRTLGENLILILAQQCQLILAFPLHNFWKKSMIRMTNSWHAFRNGILTIENRGVVCRDFDSPKARDLGFAFGWVLENFYTL